MPSRLASTFPYGVRKYSRSCDNLVQGQSIIGKSKSCIKHACMSTMCEHSSFVRKCMHEKKNARGNWRIMGQIRLICEVNYTCITCTMMFANSFHKQMYMGQTTRLKPAWRGQRCIAHRQILRGKGCFQPTAGNRGSTLDILQFIRNVWKSKLGRMSLFQH